MENFSSILGYTFITVLLLLNVVATCLVLRAYIFVKARRIYQLFFIWLVPLVGAMLTICIHKEDIFKIKHNGSKIGNNSNISNSEAIDYGISASHDK